MITFFAVLFVYRCLRTLVRFVMFACGSPTDFDANASEFIQRKHKVSERTVGWLYACTTGIMVALTVMFLLGVAKPAYGQCENGSCAAPPMFLPAAPVFLPTQTIQAPTGNAFHYEWRKVNADANVIALVRVSASRGNELVAYLDVEAGTWRWTYDGERIDLFKAAGKLRPDYSGSGTGKVVQAKPLENKAKATAVEDISKAVGKTAQPPMLIGDTADDRRKRDALDARLREHGLPTLTERLKAEGIADSLPPKPPTKGGVAESDDARDACGCDDCRCSPCKCAARPLGHVADGTVPPNGVDTSKLRIDGGGYQISGRPVGEKEAIQAVTAGTAAGVPDDGRHLRISVITADATRRKQIAAEIEQSPGFAPMKGTAIVEGYSPDGWQLKDLGFKMPEAADGVVIYAQAPSGKVLYRQDTWGGAEPYVRALREKVPGYDSAKDPQPTFGSGGMWNPWMLLVPAGAAGAYFLTRNKQQKATVPA